MIRYNKLISDNQSFSSVSEHGGSTTTISPYRESTPRKNLKKKILEIPITENKITQELDNQSKKSKVDNSIDETKKNLNSTTSIYK